MNDDHTDREDGAQGGRDTFEDDGRTCDRCGGAAVPDRSGTATVLECGDCGNVLGLADVAFDADSPTDRQFRTGEVTAADGELEQLVTLLRSEGTDADGSGPSISTDRLLLATESAILEVRAGDDCVEIREVDRSDD